MTTPGGVPDLQPQLQLNHVLRLARRPAASGTNAVSVPISLFDTDTNQDSCENTTFNFVYSGTANYTDTTTTTLTSSPNPSASGSSVTFTATVVPTGTPPSNPTGTVDFYLCSTASCSSTTLLGSGSLGAHGQAKYSTSSLAAGTDIIEAIYQGAPTDFSGSTSNTVSQVVTAPDRHHDGAHLLAQPVCVRWDRGLHRDGGQVLGTGTPTGTVNFYKCATATCSSYPHLARLRDAQSGQGHVLHLQPACRHHLRRGRLRRESQARTARAPPTSSPRWSPPRSPPRRRSPRLANPSGLGKPVTLTATVTKSSGSGTPTGTVSFYLGTPAGTHSLLGTGTLTSGKATFVTSSLPAGTDSLYAVYSGDTNFATSTSPVISQVVVSLPSRCTGNYTNWFFGNPASPNITGTNGNDFIYAFGGNFRVNDFNGDDCCFYAGDGNNCAQRRERQRRGPGRGRKQRLHPRQRQRPDHRGQRDQHHRGRERLRLGDSRQRFAQRHHTRLRQRLGDGWQRRPTTVSPSARAPTLSPSRAGATTQINAGAGNETIYLGAGTYNNYNGAAHHTNLCHLPAPPSSWHGTVAAYYHDTITNCTVVTP